MKFYLTWVVILPVCLIGQEYQADSIKVTDSVRNFIKERRIAGSGLETVRQIIEATHDPFFFIKIDRPEQKRWIADPSLAEKFGSQLGEKEKRLDELNRLRFEVILTNAQHEERRNLTREIFFGEHNLRVFNNLLSRKKMRPQDLAFVVSGSEAVEHKIRDGCTTMAHLFIALAKAAGLKDVRFVVGANVSEIRKACPRMGMNRLPDVEIDGHMVALVEIEGRWTLVNCTYFEPYSSEPGTRYELLTSLEGEEIRPDKLTGKILRLPSFQRENFPPSELLIAGVGKDGDDDLDVENHAALMNLSVSGDPKNPARRWKLPDVKEKGSSNGRN